jgi:hypothetical protein
MARSIILGFAAVHLVASAPAAAFVAAPEREFETPGPYDWVAPLSAEIQSGRDADAALDAFQARYGGTWRMIRNLATGSAAAVYGSGAALAADGDVAGAPEAEALARAFLDANAALFGVPSADLVLGDATFGLGKWGVNFFQVRDGVRIERSKVTVVMDRRGRLYAVTSDVYPDVAAPLAPAVAANAAIAVAKGALGFQAARDTEEGVSITLIPLVENERPVVHLAYKVDLEMAEPFGLWSTYVDASTGAILWRKNNYENVVAPRPIVLAETITGTVRGVFPEFNRCDGFVTGAFRNQRVQEVGGGAAAAATDTLAGAFALTVADSLPRNLAFGFVGHAPRNFARVANANGAEAADTVLATPGVPVDFVWDGTNSRLDERAAWVHGNRVHDFIKGVDPTFTGLDYQVNFEVNIPSGEGFCPGNAWWDGQNAHFCAASGSFGNTGEMGDVVYHEYGHGVSQFVYGGFGFNGAMSEGNSDILANLVNEDPVIGDGFFASACGVGIRNSNNAFVLADTTTMPEGHARGQIIAGFWWQLRGRLIETHSRIGKSLSPDNDGKILTSELWHWCRRLTKPPDELQMVLNTFIVDDDDGNLDNGTPNYDDICAAATQKGFPCPSITEGVTIAATILPSTTDTTAARCVPATITSLSAGIDPASVTLNYRVNGGSFTPVAMTNGGGGSFSACIPPQSQPSVVEYYVTATDSAGNVGFSPTAAADATPDTSDAALPPTHAVYHTYDVCLIYDDCEQQGAWVPHAPGSTATAGAWELGVPTANLSQPGYDMTPGAGTKCFVTGAAAGNVNNGVTILLSPVWDLTGSDSAVVKLRRWYVNDLDGELDRFRQDDFLIDVSNDSGQTWTNLETTNEGLDSWQEREFDLSDALGALGAVRLRFTAQDTGGTTKVEALVDEVRITAKRPIVVGVGHPGETPSGRIPARLALHANEPNPFQPQTLIRFDLPRPTTLALAVYNTSGQRVRTLVAGRRPAGTHSVVWDGKNDRGDALASGVYLLRLETPDRQETRKAILVR